MLFPSKYSFYVFQDTFWKQNFLFDVNMSKSVSIWANFFINFFSNEKAL